MAGAFAPRHEHYIVLAGIGIIVFQEEELVNTVILKCRDLDYESDRTSQTALNNEVLLPPNLRFRVNLLPAIRKGL